jgi:hypothetical protein
VGVLADLASSSLVEEEALAEGHQRMVGGACAHSWACPCYRLLEEEQEEGLAQVVEDQPMMEVHLQTECVVDFSLCWDC